MTSLISIEAPGDAGLLDLSAVNALERRLAVPRVAERDASEALRVIDRTINRLQGLRMKAVVSASRSQAGAADGLVGVGAWVARESRLGGAEAARSVKLASSLESLPHAGEALAEGLISVQHAEVIASTTKQLPPELSPAERDRVETVLTEQAKTADPTTLRKTSKRAVEIAGRSIVEADGHENQMVRTAEEVALAKAKFSLHDNEDGTTSGHFTVPSFAATVAITMGLDQLRGQLKVAGTDVGIDISAEQARRLACNTGIVPAVLGGKAVPLDLGRSTRLFSDAQRTALATTYDSYAAAGCDRPYACSELHHQQPWQHGGNTDLDQAIPLSGSHHRKIHHPGYVHHITVKPGGIKRVTFRQRT